MKTWKLTHLDLFCLGMTIKGAWTYSEVPSFETLSASLDKLIALYPQLLGTYSEEQKSLVWEDGGKPAFSQIECRGHRTGEDIYSLVKPYDIKGFKDGKVPAFSACLVKLDDGAAIVLQCAHAAMDGQSFYGLVKQWAALTRGEDVKQMVIDQSLIPGDEDIPKEQVLARIQELGWTKLGLNALFKLVISKAFHSDRHSFTLEVPQERIAAMREQTGAGTNAVLCRIAMEGLLAKLPEVKEFTLLQTADLRGRACGVPEDFFGNFSQPVVAGLLSRDFQPADAKAGLESGMDYDKVSETLRLSLCSGGYSLPYHYFDVTGMNAPGMRLVYVNNQLKLRACETDFGCGLPLRVQSADLPDMIKFWQEKAGGPVQIIYRGYAAQVMKK